MTTEPVAVNRKQRVGMVVSDHGEKTIIVRVERASRHRIYRKVIRRTKRYHVHDEENVATNGDLVRIEESRPMSRTKRWRLVEVMTEREVADVAPESIDVDLVSDVQRSAARAAAEEAAESDTAESTNDGDAADSAATDEAAPEAVDDAATDDAAIESETEAKTETSDDDDEQAG
ncbi:MAG TPA: 30S ribosomal protein S17 [Dehalococcoidia bacterium]|nr:30S ribosomal protein S17 [Dehalococcoidia bacterium]